MLNVCKDFPITEEEFAVLDKKYGSLAHYASWQLYRKNTRNSHTDEQEDIAQELKMAMIRAGSYYKRQVYIEECIELCKQYAEDGLIKKIVNELEYLWNNKTRHGASRQKFGPYQEALLDSLVRKLVPSNKRPSKSNPLKMDAKFSTYCKAITWNAQKSMGKKITKEKGIRGQMASLSEFDFLGGK